MCWDRVAHGSKRLWARLCPDCHKPRGRTQKDRCGVWQYTTVLRCIQSKLPPAKANVALSAVQQLTTVDELTPKQTWMAYTAATARHDASEQADASCPRLPVVGVTRFDRGRGQAVARETGWISRRGEFKREDGTDREGERRRAETKEQNAEEGWQEEDVENRSPEETQEEQEQERRDQEEQEQERRDQEEQEQERRAQEKERRAQEKERRAQEKERRDQEKETPQETEGEETPSEERYNASHDPGGSWLTKVRSLWTKTKSTVD
ncbi:hypothetical protein NDU88_000341 [Pleurodeles waltl]|uniref:Uncharacterized protein n=1 Tax=Pleurodeles waltl TaxID=8319 RepID=A0AAV7V829_PLEWA|nr:hypothetical protein NDU88_000341 [Pleurodeles waltl]